MKKRILLLATIGATLLLLNLPAGASLAGPDTLSYLPASDGLMLIDVRRLVTQTVPRILTADPGKIAQANSEIEKFKTRTGIDLRSFDRVVVASRFSYPSPNVTRLDTVAIAHGAFNAKDLAASVKSAANVNYREEKYHGATIMMVGIHDQLKLLGLWNMQVNELAICALDPNSLAMGSLSQVQAAIDAGRQGHANADLAALASRDPNAVIGFAANVPGTLLDSLNVGNDTIAKDVHSIRQLYGSIGSTQNDVSVTLVARTDTAESAGNLKDTVTGLTQLGGFVISRMTEPRKSLAQSALDNLKITTRGNELEIRTQVTATSLAALIK